MRISLHNHFLDTKWTSISSNLPVDLFPNNRLSELIPNMDRYVSIFKSSLLLFSLTSYAIIKNLWSISTRAHAFSIDYVFALNWITSNSVPFFLMLKTNEGNLLRVPSQISGIYAPKTLPDGTFQIKTNLCLLIT